MKSCDDVIRELAAPTDDRDPAALEAHLVSCPSCALWADRNAGLDRLWAATTPDEPSAAAWDAVWAQVASGLSTAEAPAPLRLVAAERSPWSRRGRVVLGIAQAAALLIAATLLLRQSSPNPRPEPGPAVALVTPETSEFDIEVGQVVMIPVQGNGELLELAPEPATDLPDACDDQIVMLGAMEALAQGGANW